MPHRRTLTWSSAMRDLRTARAVAVPVFYHHDAFDLAAIMREAVRQARRFLKTLPLTWAQRMQIALRSVWAKAKQAAVAGRIASRA